MILCSGCFDGLHAGHVSYLLAAAAECQLGEPLVVAVAPDAYIRRVKGREPSWPVVDRLLTVEALDMVNRAQLHGVDGVADVIYDLHPRLLVKGEDWRGRLPADVREACHIAHTDIVYVPERPTRHTHEISTLVAR